MATCRPWGGPLALGALLGCGSGGRGDGDAGGTNGTGSADGTGSQADTADGMDVSGDGGGSGGATFGPRSDYPVSAPGLTITHGDMDGDGAIDLVVGVQGSVALLRGDGTGVFEAAEHATGCNFASALAVAELDGADGRDVLCSDNFGDALVVFAGAADGTLTAMAPHPVMGGPGDLAVGDFDGDGTIDAAVGNASNAGEGISVALGLGDGTFAETVGYGETRTLDGIAAADFDGDGTIDLVAGSVLEGALRHFAGVGDGTFAPAVTIGNGDNVTTVRAGDFDGDGASDVAAMGAASLTVLLGVGDGTFNSGPSHDLGTATSGLALADFDGDGRLDAAAPSLLADTVVVARGRGDGTFDPIVELATAADPTDLTAADFDGDGRDDLAVVTDDSATVTVLLSSG